MAGLMLMQCDAMGCSVNAMQQPCNAWGWHGCSLGGRDWMGPALKGEC